MYVREFVKKIGGMTEVSNICEVSEQAVCRWYKSGIPYGQAKKIWNHLSANMMMGNYTVGFIMDLRREVKK